MKRKTKKEKCIKKIEEDYYNKYKDNDIHALFKAAYNVREDMGRSFFATATNGDFINTYEKLNIEHGAIVTVAKERIGKAEEYLERALKAEKIIKEMQELLGEISKFKL